MIIPLEWRSPVKLNGRPTKTENRDGCRIVIEYEGTSKGPHIIDLSHFRRWDVQDKRLEQVRPFGNIIPAMPGQVSINKNMVIGRLNGTQAIVWHFSRETAVIPQFKAFTDVTNAAVAIALVGPSVFEMVEKLCALDLSDPHQQPPFLIQGPFSHVPCHIWVLDRNDTGGCIALTCSRGYAQDMVNSILQAGAQWNIEPQGESTFRTWMGW